ncbi:PAS domain-containing protein [Corynebacterium lubricantis]|uniref:PAS domain-containing protein n=1 Tax=Corynebacterium lubricantis TaxID=541095 RepID=UPI00036F2422|nr:PAS domain S-box protein [Corynebacterium lubricantis]
MSENDTNATELSTRIISETTLDAVIYADKTGVIRLWNDAATTLFGYSREEALGKSLDLIIPEKHRDAHWTGWDRVMETGVTRYGQEPLSAPALKSTGEKISLEFSITMLKDAEGKIEGIAAILRDVTKRWNAERAVRDELRQLKESQA